jgi:hypothetical protein
VRSSGVKAHFPTKRKIVPILLYDYEMWCEGKKTSLLFPVVGQNIRIKINVKSTSNQEAD